MSKVSTISIKNFKAIDAVEADFKGCTAIITGGNNKGKTSFLKGMPDRIRFVRPDVIVKEGKEKGTGEMTLTTGERFIWEFDTDGTDKITYITSDGVKGSVTKEVSKRFFPATFDIDKFLQSAPKEQSKQLQAIIGIDFTDIDARYKIAYDDRTYKNKEAERFHAKIVEMLEVPKVEKVDLTELQSKKEAEKTRLNNLYTANKTKNDTARKQWNDYKDAINVECNEHNEAQTDLRVAYNQCKEATVILIKNGFDKEVLDTFVKSLADKIQPDRIASEHYPVEPEYIQEVPDRATLDEIDNQILEASKTNIAAEEYQNYIKYKGTVEAAKDEAAEADAIVKAIEKEREAMIQTAKFPQGIAITPDGITIDGFPLDRNQISTSKLYTTALRIAAMNLGEVKTLYFDASFLDRNSLAEIEGWAEENDLQLLIERPDFEGGEIRYEIIEQSQTNSKSKKAS